MYSTKTASSSGTQVSSSFKLRRRNTSFLWKVLTEFNSAMNLLEKGMFSVVTPLIVTNRLKKSQVAARFSKLVTSRKCIILFSTTAGICTS